MLEDLRKNYQNLKLSVRRLGIVSFILSVALAVLVASMAGFGYFGRKAADSDSSAKTVRKVKNTKQPPAQELLTQPTQMKVAMGHYRKTLVAKRQITISRSGQRGSGLTIGDALTAEQIEACLKRYGSPMAPYAQNIADAARRHNVNPALIIAIAGVESSFGKHAPGCNAWGWGGKRWSSWPEAIEDYTQSLSQKYLRRCRTIEDINRRYCPNRRWSSKVRHFYSQILNI